MLCVVFFVCVYHVNAEEAKVARIDDCNKVFKAYTAERATTYLTGDNVVPTKEGYLFAGWYTTDDLPENSDEAIEYIVEDSIPEGVDIVYALFVPEEVLSVKAQISQHLTDAKIEDKDEKGVIRFVTTVDSVLYQSVGFDISYQRADGSTKKVTKTSNKVYKKLYEADSTDVWETYPYEAFCGVSEYFKICTITDVPQDNYATEFTVKPFWITLSGDKVYGQEAIKVFENGCFREDVYVSSSVEGATDLPYYGTKENPYASLDYAIAHVEDGGTVHVTGELQVATTATWTKHGKTVTITGDGEGTLDFSTQSAHLNIRDNVEFTALNLKFKQYVFCNGYHVKVASDTVVLENSTGTYIYGGAQSATVKSTNLELYAGSYLFIYGGGHNENAHVTGDTNVVVGPGVNPSADTTSHDKTYVLYGGCRMASVGGNTNVTVLEAGEGQTPAKFNYVYGGGGYNSSTKTTATVAGTTNVEFAGNAYALYGGGRYGTNADTRVVMTGGIVYQVFGGGENNSMTGNTDVQILGGDVLRRVYGGCYNEWEGTWKTSQKVTGQTSVTVGTNLSLNKESDMLVCSYSRYNGAELGEKGIMILRNGLYDSLSSKIKNFSGNDAYNYLVCATVGGAVSHEGNCIYIKPQDGNHATVRLDNATTGEVVYYAEEAGYYVLPELVNDERKVYVSFDTSIADEFRASAAAKINTVYYKTLEEAMTAAEKLENAVITDLSATKQLASISIADCTNGTVTSNYKNCIAGTEVALTVEPEKGYYCKSLTVKKNGTEIELSESALTGGTYSFITEVGTYLVEAEFAKEVFKVSTNNGYSSWDLVGQNQKTETIANGGTKITGTVIVTDMQTKDKMDAIEFVDKFKDMDFTFVAKDDPSTTTGNSTPGTQVVLDFDGYAYQVRVVKNSNNIVLRVVGGMSANTNMYTLTTAQAQKFASAEGVSVRVVRYGTEVMFYVDGVFAYKAELSKLNELVTDDRAMKVSIKRFGDTGAAIAIPYTVIDTVIPVAVNVKGTTNGTITIDRNNYFAGDVATITVNAKSEDYYCNKLSVSSKDEPISLNKALNMNDTTYSFVVGESTCTIEATFAKKVFKVSTNNGYSSWDLVGQNQKTETIANGGTKITGTVIVTDMQTKDKMDAIEFVDKFKDMDFTFVAKDDPSTTTGNSTPGTQVVLDFDGYAYQVRVVKNSNNIVLRVVGGMSANTNMYTFTTVQAQKFASVEGVSVRVVRCGTEVMFYVDGTYAYTADLSKLNAIVTDDREMKVSIKRFGDTGTAIAIPYTVINKVTASVKINAMTNGTVTKDKQGLYSVGDKVTLTVAPETGYYCNSLVVKKDGAAIELDKVLNMTDATYSFEVGDASYTVEATFAKKVFKIATSNGYTSWNLMGQNEATETLANGGTKISGTLLATDTYGSDKMDLVTILDTTFDETFKEMEMTYVAKNDPSTTEGSATPGTQVEIKINGYTYKVRAVKNGDNIVLRVTGGMSSNTNMYTFTTAQAEKFASSEGVLIRVIKTGTTVTFYVDGTFAYSADLATLSDKVMEDKAMTVSLGRFGDKGTEIAIPYTISNKVSPVAFQVHNGNTLVAVEADAKNVQDIHLTSNETYNVKLTPQGFDSTAYFKITYVDHVTKETQSVYTPAVAAGENFEFKYQNGLFDVETESEIATIRWENRIKATKDVLRIEVINGTPEGDAPMAKPTATVVETEWTIGTNVGSDKHSVTVGFTPGQHYAHTEVITVPKAGTKLSFTDDIKTNSWASDGCYVVSSWKKNESGEWELDLEGTNIRGKASASQLTCSDGYNTFVERYGTEDTDGSITYTYITSKDNENIMFCYYAGKGTTKFPTITSIYSGEMGTAEEIALAEKTSTWLENDKTRAYYDIFEGKTISVIGDSYMAGSSIANKSDVWVNMFATKYNMTMNNHGVNGSTISNYAGAVYNPMVDRWAENFANDNPDIIIVEGGRNDYNYNTPMGVLGTSDKKTFKGATTYLISSLRKKYPNAMIIGITCWEVGGDRNAAGYYCSDYGRAFIEVCEALGVSYINSMDSDAMGVYMTSANYRGRFCIKAGDISHLNEKGMKLVLPTFERKIYGFYDEYLNQ